MRTTIIPAQITTVEDKIAGSLNMTQILILMFPVLWTALVYILLPKPMGLSAYKLMLIFASILICITLVIRIKDKIVADWLGVILRYQLRPKYWLFNKNDLTSRTVDLPDIPNIALTHHKALNRTSKKSVKELDVADLVKIQSLLDSGKVAVRYQFEKK